jgi:hypothetical protein
VYWGALHPAEDAEQIACREMQWRWHRLYGWREPEWRCAGCCQQIGGLALLTLGDGNRVHLDRLDCLLRFGERWRSEAAAGLHAIGLDPPADPQPI